LFPTGGTCVSNMDHSLKFGLDASGINPVPLTGERELIEDPSDEVREDIIEARHPFIFMVYERSLRLPLILGRLTTHELYSSTPILLQAASR
jgi:hypothetical protein